MPRRLSTITRRIAVLVAALLALQVVLPVVAAHAMQAERAALRALGLDDQIICHDGNGAPAGKLPAEGQRPAPSGKPSHACDCCLAGCGVAAIPASPPPEHNALLRPLQAAEQVTRRAEATARLRSWLTERTRSPRSPPLFV